MIVSIRTGPNAVSATWSHGWRGDKPRWHFKSFFFNIRFFLVWTILSLITSVRRWVASLLHVPITWHSRANTQVRPLAVGHVLFVLFHIFFPNIITPEEKLGCSEQRWMMQYSANPIMYVLVKCVAGLFYPLLSELLWSIYYFTKTGLAKGCKETLKASLWRVMSDTVCVTALNGFRRSWAGELLNRYLHLTFKQTRQSLQHTVWYFCTSSEQHSTVWFSSEHPFIYFSLKRG